MAFQVIDFKLVSKQSIFYDQITLRIITRNGFAPLKIKAAIDIFEDKYQLSNDQIFNIYLLEELYDRLAYLPSKKNNEAKKIRDY